MNVLGFSPESGWPGTIIKITGDGFSENRDENRIEVGGERALVMEAASDRLIVVAGEQTRSGLIAVTVGSTTANSTSDFTVLPYPSPDKLMQSGAPRFFHGPQNGTPKTGVKNQLVRVLLTYPTDQDPGNAINRNILRNDLIARFDNARQFWDEASYGSTTWAMGYSDWLPLPHERRFYCWQSEDIDDARLELFLRTTRSLAFDGTRIFYGTPTGWSLIHHPNPMTFTFSSAGNTGGSRATALRLDGNRLYAGTEAGQVFAFDVTDINSPIELGSIALPNSQIMAIDVSGANLLIAGRQGGIHWVNAANPGAMTLVSTIMTGGEWAMCAKVFGTRGYVGTGSVVRVFNLSGAAPALIANVTVSSWVTDVDVFGRLCAIGTDGDGLQVFEVTELGIVIRSAFRNTLRVRQVKLIGNLAYLAGNAHGFVMVDLTNLASPVPRGQMLTTKPCFNVEGNGNVAILALGAKDLIPINVSNPNNPVRYRTETPSPTDPDLGALQNSLTMAINMRDQVRDTNPLFVDAIRAWLATTGNSLVMDQGIIVVVNGGFLRGASWVTSDFAFQGKSINFSHQKGAIYLAYGASSGRIAHEIGHWLGMGDIYEERFADGTILEGTAQPWCLGGLCDNLPLFCAQQITDVMGFYHTAAPTNPNVFDFGWGPNSIVDQTIDLVAHDAAEDTTPEGFHILRIRVAEGLYYYVEVRQMPTGPVFDQNIPVPPGEPGLVVVTRVTQSTSFSNTFERPIMLFGLLRPGEQVVDAMRNLIIRVESLVQARPLIYRVRVQWNQPISGDPNGKFDFTITPWSTDTWETVDVWIDSPRNGPDYEFFEGSKNNPILNGDRPWVRHNNRIFARIHNTGPQDVSNVYVTCYVSSPPGIGDNEVTWVTLNTRNIPLLPGHASTLVDFDWKPSENKHTCLKIAILPQIGEIEPHNNKAHENVCVFDSEGASSHQPVVLEAEVRSPFVIWRKVDLIVQGLPEGWHAVVDKSWVWLEGHGSSPVKAIIWTDRSSTIPNQDHGRIPPIAYARVEGWTHFDHRYIPIGGILAAVKAVKKVNITVEVYPGGDTIYVNGGLDPRLANIPITMEVIDEKGNSWVFYSVTQASGSFQFNSSSQGIRFDKGTYSVQIFVTAGGDAGQGETDPIKIQII